MALPRYVAGTVPGQLDISQPSRVLQTPQSTLLFADYDGRPLPPPAQSQLDSLFATLHSRRIVVDVSPNGVIWRHVPSALLNGAPDEGTWPRLVNCWGAETVNMTREQWEIHKIDDGFTCIVDAVMAHIYPAGRVPDSILGVAGTQTPISPPATDSDAKQQPKAGSSAQPYVVEDSDRPSASPSTPRRSAPRPDHDARPNPYAARVETEAESDEESEAADEGAFQPPVDPSPAATFAAAPSEAAASQAPPRPAKRKASASPDKADLLRARSPPIIVLSSDDSGAETETQSHTSKNAPGTPRPIYRRAIIDPVGGPSLHNGNKRRKLDADYSLPSFRHAFPDIPVYEWATASGAGSSPKRARPTTSAPLGASFSRWRSPAPSVRPAKPRYKFNLRPRTAPSEREEEHPVEKPTAHQPEASSSKRRASESPDIQEIPDPGPSMKRKRHRTDDPRPPQTPKSAARRERAERKAAREKIKREARPTASVFPSDLDPWADLFSRFGAHAYMGPQPTPLFTPASFYYPFAAAPPPQPGPSACGSADQQHESSPEVEEVFADGTDSSSADEHTDIDEERAAFIAEAKRKLAELERDRPLWEEAARKRKLQEQREAEEKHRRDQERRRAERLAEEERRKAQRWEFYQKREKMRRDYERQQEEARAREQARTQERFERYKNTYSSSYWAYGSFGGTSYYPPPPHSHAHARRPAAASTSTSVWTPALALERYNTQCATFDSTKFSEEKKLALDAIPWPVLARPPVSVNLVDWDTVGEFFKTVRLTMSKADFAALVDKSHKRWHPDRWRSRTGAFRFIAGTQAQQEEVEKKVNMVSQVLTPLWQETR